MLIFKIVEATLTRVTSSSCYPLEPFTSVDIVLRDRHSLSAPGHNDQLLYRDHSPDTWFLLAVSQIYDNAMIEKINHYSGQKNDDDPQPIRIV